MFNSTTALAIVAATAALAVSACGGASKTTSTAASSPQTSTAAAPSTTASTATPPSAAASGLAVAADPSGQLKFTKTSLTAKAGKVKIAFTNKAPLPHNLTIQQGTNGPTIGATPTFQGGTKTLIVNLKAGTYTFFCSVPGHRDGGMKGTLTVR